MRPNESAEGGIVFESAGEVRAMAEVFRGVVGDDWSLAELPQALVEDAEDLRDKMGDEFELEVDGPQFVNYALPELRNASKNHPDPLVRLEVQRMLESYKAVMDERLARLTDTIKEEGSPFAIAKLGENGDRISLDSVTEHHFWLGLRRVVAEFPQEELSNSFYEAIEALDPALLEIIEATAMSYTEINWEEMSINNPDKLFVRQQGAIAASRVLKLAEPAYRAVFAEALSDELLERRDDIIAHEPNTTEETALPHFKAIIHNDETRYEFAEALADVNERTIAGKDLSTVCRIVIKSAPHTIAMIGQLEYGPEALASSHIEEMIAERVSQHVSEELLSINSRGAFFTGFRDALIFIFSGIQAFAGERDE